MPTRIPAGVGYFLTFITMIPIDCKITNFHLRLFDSFLKEIMIITSWHTPNY